MIPSEQENKNLKDEYNLLYILCYLMGGIALLPLSVISNSQSYWKFKFRNTNEPWDPVRNEITELQKEFTAAFSATGIIFTYLSVALSARFARNWNILYRIIAGFSFLTAVMGVFLLLVNVNTDNWQTPFLYLSIIMVALVATFIGFLTFALLQLSSRFPPKYIAATIAGESLSGVFSSSLQIVTLLVNSFPISSAILNFALALFLIFSMLVSFISLTRYSPFLQYHLYHVRKQEDDEQPVKINMSLVVTILKHQKCMLIALCVVGAGTSIINPGITATVKSVNIANGSMWTVNLFVPVVVFLMYNIIDIMGRQLAITIDEPKSNTAIFIFSAARLVLVPLILMCNLAVKSHTPVVFKSDTVFIVLMALLSLSSGYLGNIIILGLPRNYTNPKREKDATLGVLVACTFLTSSSCNLLSVVLTKIL